MVFQQNTLSFLKKGTTSKFFHSHKILQIKTKRTVFKLKYAFPVFVVRLFCLSQAALHAAGKFCAWSASRLPNRCLAARKTSRPRRAGDKYFSSCHNYYDHALAKMAHPRGTVNPVLGQKGHAMQHLTELGTGPFEWTRPCLNVMRIHTWDFRSLNKMGVLEGSGYGGDKVHLTQFLHENSSEISK
jgi:hypothetical protein